MIISPSSLEAAAAEVDEDNGDELDEDGGGRRAWGEEGTLMGLNLALFLWELGEGLLMSSRPPSLLEAAVLVPCATDPDDVLQYYTDIKRKKEDRASL